MADENNTNNQNSPKEILTFPGIILGFTVIVVIILLCTSIGPGIHNYINLSQQYSEQKKEYDDASNKLKTLEETSAAAEEAATNSEGIDKEFFRPLEAGVDSESILATEFSEILDLMKSNQIKTRSVKYKYDEQTEDNFYKSSNGKFSVCQLDMDMIATYTNFKNFMKDLYKHEHYLDIASVEVVPYPKNKTILLITLRLKLYAEKV